VSHDDATSRVVRFPKKRKGRTAEEFMRELETDPDYVARRDEYMRQWRAKVEENFRAAAPVKADLAKVGIHVGTVSQLLHVRLKDFPAAIPVLLRWLPRMENLDIKEAIVRALTDRAARPLAAPALIEEFRKIPPTDVPRLLSLKWAIGNALYVVADDRNFGDVVELVRDKRHGWARDMLAVLLGRMKNPKAFDVLVELLDEDEGQLGQEAAVIRSAIQALGNRHDPRAVPYIQRFINHPEPIVRKEAEKSLQKIARAERKAREKEAKRKRQ
jgi:hypothetical protein